MAEAKEKTVQRSYRLPVEDVQFIELLAAQGGMGSNKSAVVRQLLKMAIKEIVDSDYPKKREALVEWLKLKSKQPSN